MDTKRPPGCPEVRPDGRMANRASFVLGYKPPGVQRFRAGFPCTVMKWREDILSGTVSH